MWEWQSLLQITHVCGCGSDGATALLSACSLVRCCSHQFDFPCLEVLLQGTPPPCKISCKTLPGHSVDADSLHISCAYIFISQVRAASGSPPQCQLTVEDVFWDATILQPTQSALSEQGVNSGKTGPRQDMVVQQSLKPTDLQLPACFVYQSLSKELESNVQKQNMLFLSARWHHHDCLLLIRPGGATATSAARFVAGNSPLTRLLDSG